MIKNMITVENAIDQLKHYLSEVELRAKFPVQKRALYNNIEALNVIIDWYNTTQYKPVEVYKTKDDENNRQVADLLSIPQSLYLRMIWIKKIDPNFYHYYYNKYLTEFSIKGIRPTMLRLFSEIDKQWILVEDIRDSIKKNVEMCAYCSENKELNELIPKYDELIKSGQETLRLLTDYSDMAAIEQGL